MENTRKKRETGIKRSSKPALSGTEIAAKVHTLAEPVLEMEGLELVLVEYRKEPVGQVLRMYIDRPGGVTVEDCAYTSRQISDLLDVYLEGETTYRLEVSSPGANRPLTKEKHFQDFAGHRTAIRLKEPLGGRKNFTGILEGAQNGIVTIACDQETFAIPRDAILSARLRQ
ncbi:MAG: ribosome maturation factor RimP [Desulfatibacillaceae bacterium]